MRTHTRATGLLSITLLALTAPLVNAPAAQADPLDTYAAAYAATSQAAQTSGIDIVVLSTSNKVRAPGVSGLRLPAGVQVRLHYEANPQGWEYASYRIARTKAMLGAWGVNPGESSWATLSAIYGDWPARFAQSRRLARTTAITKLDDRMPTLDLDSGMLQQALVALVSPSANSTFADEIGWSADGIAQSVQADGSTVITAQSGSGDREGEDDCTYGPLRIVINQGLIRSTKWQARCPGGEKATYQGTVAYEADVDGSTAPRLTEADAFARPSRPNLAAWQQLSAAANRTATTAFASVSVANQRGLNEPNAGVIRGLDFLDDLMRYGNVGTPRPMPGPDGSTSYLIAAPAGANFLLRTSLDEIDSVTVDVGPDGIIRSIRTATDSPPDVYTSVFTR
ncbi:MAG: hypothetical protein KGP12_02275 [Actinomycetales bacterium]|nr:hypothetical protein [Actinomycetales bacterium]